MKKILAGVLAAASLLSMTVSASAATNDKKVAAAGEVEYDVSVTAPKVVLDLVMPAKMEAQLNPYGAEIKLDATNLVTNGIAGVAYKIDNKTKDYGIYIDATATTTVTRAVKTEEWTVKTVTANKKSAALALVGGNDAAEIKAVAAAAMLPSDDPGYKAIANAQAGLDPADDTKLVQGALVMDSTKEADTTNKIPAGRTNQKKMMFVGAQSAGYMAFIGNLGAGADDEWFEDDAINVALVLKVVAGPTKLGATTDNGVTFNGVTDVTDAEVEAAAEDNGITNLKLTKTSATGATKAADEYSCDLSVGEVGTSTDIKTLFNLNLGSDADGNDTWAFANSTTYIKANGRLQTAATAGETETATISLDDGSGTDLGTITIVINFVD